MRFEVFQKLLAKTKNKSVRFHENDENVLVKAVSPKKLYRTFISGPDNAASKDELKNTQARLAAVTEANRVISSESNLKKLFKTILDQVFNLTPAHNGVILIVDEATGELRIEFAKRGLKSQSHTVSKTITNRAFETGEAILTLDAADDSRFSDGKSIIIQNISSAMCVPLVFQKKKLGVIYIDTHGTTNAFNHDDLELLVALSSSASIAVKNSLYLHELEQAYHDHW